MSTSEPTPHNRSTPPLTPANAVHLLEVCVTGPLRPVDRVIQRLHEADSQEWFTHAMAVAADLTGHEVARLPEQAPSLDELVRMKERAKQTSADASSLDLALCAIFTYLACVGTALAHHGRNITSREPTELEHILVDLADAVPPRWREMLLKAVLTGDETS